MIPFVPGALLLLPPPTGGITLLVSAMSDSFSAVLWFTFGAAIAMCIAATASARLGSSIVATARSILLRR